MVCMAFGWAPQLRTRALVQGKRVCRLAPAGDRPGHCGGVNLPVLYLPYQRGCLCLELPGVVPGAFPLGDHHQLPVSETIETRTKLSELISSHHFQDKCIVE